MTHILIAEDEEPQRNALTELLKSLWPDATVTACADGLTALEAFEREHPQTVFLDIRMPGLTGLELAEVIGPRAHIVFVTAHDDYAVKAFEHAAVDYLLKPVERERLLQTVSRLRSRKGVVSVAQAIEAIAAAKPQTLSWISASVGDVVRLYAIEDVIAFHAQDKYTRVITASDDAIIRRSLKELAQQLDPEVFRQVHRSLIVRITAIDTIWRDEGGQSQLTLKGRKETFQVAASIHGAFRGM